MIHQVPFPKSSNRTFVGVLSVIAASVAFILIVFEPFGTSSFSHQHKSLILAGYGIVSLIVGTVYHYIVTALLPVRVIDRWTVLHEVFYVFSCLLFSITGCFIYWQVVFGITPSLSSSLYFLMYASSVALVPMLGYYAVIYVKYREVRYGDSDHDVGDSRIDFLRITGRNKDEVSQVVAANLLFVQSNDNYVILHLADGDLVARKMLRNTLTDVAAQLDDSFLKVHRQYVVNLSRVTEISGNITNAKLSIAGTQKQVPVSRSKVAELRKML
jgi:hypothetical protein